MTRWLLLTGTVAILTATAAWEILRPDTAPDSIAPRPPAPVAEPTKPAAPTTRSNEMLSTIAAAVLARPLFSPDRRAAPDAGGAKATTVTDELPRLSGVIVGPSGRGAIFADSSGHAKVAREGGSIGKFTVRAIAPGQVTLTSPEGDRVVRPSFTSSSTANTGAPPPPMATGPGPGQPPFQQPGRERAR